MEKQVKEKFVLCQPSDKDLVTLEYELISGQDDDLEKPKLKEFNGPELVLSFLRRPYNYGHVGIHNMAIPGSQTYSEASEVVKNTPVSRLLAVSGNKKFGAYAALRILRTEEAFSYFCEDVSLLSGASRRSYDAFKKALPDGELPVLFFEGCFRTGADPLFNSLWLMAIRFAMRHEVSAIVALEEYSHIQDIEGGETFWSVAVTPHDDEKAYYELSDEVSDDLGKVNLRDYGTFDWTDHGPFVQNGHPGRSSSDALKIVPRASFSKACDKLVEQGATALEWMGDIPAEFQD